MKNKENFKKNIGNRIKLERTKRGESQTQLARHLGIERSALSLIELGKNFPSVETLMGLSETFNVSTDWILTGDTGNISIDKEDMDFVKSLVTFLSENQESRNFVKTLFFLISTNKEFLNSLREEVQFNFQLFGKKV